MVLFGSCTSVGSQFSLEVFLSPIKTTIEEVVRREDLLPCLVGESHGTDGLYPSFK